MLSPSPASACALSSTSLNLFSTGRLLLSPGVPTDKGEGVAGSVIFYSVRNTYRGPDASSVSPLASTPTHPAHMALGISCGKLHLFSTGRLLLSPGVPTDKGEGVAGSAILYSVRNTYRVPPHPAFPLLPQLQLIQLIWRSVFLVGSFISSFSAM